MGLVSSIDLT